MYKIEKSRCDKHDWGAALQSQKAVAVHLKSKQVLPFDFA